jgi:hypothetical protein
VGTPGAHGPTGSGSSRSCAGGSGTGNAPRWCRRWIEPRQPFPTRPESPRIREHATARRSGAARPPVRGHRGARRLSRELSPGESAPAGHGGAGPHRGADVPAGAGEPAAPALPGVQLAQDGMLLEVDRSSFASRSPARPFSFASWTRRGRPIRDFEVAHERRMHFIVVRRDLAGFQHLHPAMEPDGTWTTDVDFGEGGTYRVFADFTRGGRAADAWRRCPGRRLVPSPPASCSGGQGPQRRRPRGRAARRCRERWGRCPARVRGSRRRAHRDGSASAAVLSLFIGLPPFDANRYAHADIFSGAFRSSATGWSAARCHIAPPRLLGRARTTCLAGSMVASMDLPAAGCRTPIHPRSACGRSGDRSFVRRFSVATGYLALALLALTLLTGPLNLLRHKSIPVLCPLSSSRASSADPARPSPSTAWLFRAELPGTGPQADRESRGRRGARA